MNPSHSSDPRPTTRRDFLKTSAVLAGSAALGQLAIERSAHAAGSDVIRIGLIGCGGRGTEAANNAMNSGKDVRLVALADLFDERLQASRAQLKQAKPDQVEVKDDHCFVGFDAYQKLLASGVDAVLIAAASHFHPQMLKAAVEAGKHVFCEKPHGIDIPGLKISMAAAEEAKQKGLSLVSGLCWRYDPGVRETMKRVHDGAIGDIVAIQENYVSSPYIVRERRPGQSEMEYQMWNWHYDKPRENMYDLEHKELFASIRAGQPIHNGHYLCLSSALAIAAQIACYSGALLMWEDVMNSKRSFALPRYGWDVAPPVKPGSDGRYPTAMQGNAEYHKWQI